MLDQGFPLSTSMEAIPFVQNRHHRETADFRTFRNIEDGVPTNDSRA